MPKARAQGPGAPSSSPCRPLIRPYSTSTARGFASLTDPRVPRRPCGHELPRRRRGPLLEGHPRHRPRLRHLVRPRPSTRVSCSTASTGLRTPSWPSRPRAPPCSTSSRGREPLDKHLVEGAVSSIVLSFVEEEASMVAARAAALHHKRHPGLPRGLGQADHASHQGRDKRADPRSHAGLYPASLQAGEEQHRCYMCIAHEGGTSQVLSLSLSLYNTSYIY